MGAVRAAGASGSAESLGCSELTFIIGYQTFASKFAKAWRLTPQGFSS